MAKGYIFIYAMVIIFSIFISITNCSLHLCEKTEDCHDLVCFPPKVLNCNFNIVEGLKSILGYGVCECT
ncbi:unnamed protein product [Trifolium pratense]|uniref:Uncharacterized protein n=1 Tax=Trifolium pratense TaxID=57577 RepID=A0ACB0KTH6_TRIPR|nr:unnamed protein product [Trifolium pratense]